MPELPEVETTAALVRPHLEGRRVRGVGVDWQRSIGATSPRDFERAVVGARITAVGRRAKYIVMELARGRARAGALLCHLRMTGRLVVQPPRADPGPYRRVSLILDRGVLHFLDVRKFGRLTWHADPAERLAALGPEPLGDAFTVAWLRAALRARRRALKPLLLDQEFLAGLGNIYVDESLHGSGLHPLRRSDRVPRAGVARLHAEIQRVLRAAIAREGSSFDAFYRTPEGQPGSYQDQFQVYGRDGDPCRRCGRTLVRIVVGQRGTHLCTRCQPAPRPRGASSP
jgi:formamidopyrimidine-DNA glycosylase